MGSVVIGVQCVAAHGGKCYARELVAVAEEFHVPLTWLIGVSARDPMGNANLYRNDYLHRIPSWHEIGLLLDLGNGGAGNERPRSDLVRLGKEVLKQCHVKPTACWTLKGDVDTSLLRALEDAGMLVLVAPEMPDGDAPVGLFRPSHERPSEPGDASLFRLSRPVIDLGAGPDDGALLQEIERSPVTLLSTRDDRDDTERLRKALQQCLDHGSSVRVMTAAIRD